MRRLVRTEGAVGIDRGTERWSSTSAGVSDIPPDNRATQRPVSPVRGRRRTGTGESSAPIWRCRWRSIGWALWDVWPLAYSAELGGVHVVIASRLSGELRSWPRSDRLLEVLDDCSDEAVEMTLEVGAWRLPERGADSRSTRDDIKCRVRQRLRAEVVAPVAGCGTYQVEVRTAIAGVVVEPVEA